MQFFIITLITLIITFSLNPLLKRLSSKNPAKLHIHHSVLGVLLIVIGLIARHKVVVALGLGIYLGHVAEEMYFNKRNVIKALLIFVTR
jgi:hypothetical protein